MRDLVLGLATLLMVPVSAIYPGAGILAWVWFSIESPHRMVYGFTAGKPLNSLIAAATLLGWLFHKGDKRLPGDWSPWILLIFIIWLTFNMMTVPFFDYSFDEWNMFMRFFLEIFMAFFLLTTKVRIQGVIWILIISLGYYGVKGGVYTIAHGGHGTVIGPPGTMIADNNNLALAVVMVLPLVYYAWRTTAAPWIRFGLLIAIALQVIMVFGTYSRGGAIALGTMLFMFWLRSDRKIVYALAGAVIVAGGLSVMPAAFWARMHTLHNVEADGSFMGRVYAWQVAFDYARDHFPFGAGFAAPQLPAIFNHYLPGMHTHAAHSIYFEVLGEHGFVGLALYLAFLFCGLRNTLVVLRHARGRPDLEWAADLARMIQVSLISYYVGGAALSVAYYDGFLLQFAIISNLRRIVARREVPVAIADGPSPDGVRRRAARHRGADLVFDP